MKKWILFLILSVAASQIFAAETMRTKAQSLTLPTVQYRDATVQSILVDIQKQSVELDAEGIGINFVLTIGPDLLNRTLTMTLAKPTVERVLKFIASTAPIYFQYEDAAIVVRINTNTTEAAD